MLRSNAPVLLHYALILLRLCSINAPIFHLLRLVFLTLMTPFSRHCPARGHGTAVLPILSQLLQIDYAPKKKTIDYAQNYAGRIIQGQILMWRWWP
jgi:hypothetical protein